MLFFFIIQTNLHILIVIKVNNINDLPLPVKGALFTVLWEIFNISGGGLLGITEMFCVVELVPVVKIFTWLLLDIVPEYPEFIVTVLPFIGIIGGGGDDNIDEISVCNVPKLFNQFSKINTNLLVLGYCLIDLADLDLTGVGFLVEKL